MQRAAEILRRNAIAQAQLVSDLLDLSRLQLGKFSLNRQVVSLTKTINDAVETVRAEALAKGLESKVNVDMNQFLWMAIPAWNRLFGIC